MRIIRAQSLRLMLVVILVSLLWVIPVTGKGVRRQSNTRNLTAEQNIIPAGLTPAEWAQIVVQIPVPVQEAKVSAGDAQSSDFFGNNVAVDGDTVVIGALGEAGGKGDPLWHAGAAYIFERNQGGINQWGQVAKLTASDPGFYDQFGQAVAISNETIAVGAPYENGGPGNPLPDAGAVYVFDRDFGGAGNWGQVKKLVAGDPGEEDDFGLAISLDGDTLAVSAPAEDGGSGDPLPYAGAVYVFERHQGGMDNWGQVKKLMAGDADSGDGFGYAVAVNDDTLVTGTPAEDGGPGNPLVWAGAAYIFERNQGGSDNWGEVVKLAASDAGMNDRFGQAAAIDDDIIVIGAPHEDGGPGDPLFVAGAAYIFERNQGGTKNWGEVEKLNAGDPDEGDLFAGNVAIQGNIIVAGTVYESGGPGDPLPNAGAAYVFIRDQSGTGNWEQAAKLMASDAQTDDFFGGSVAVSSAGVVFSGATNGDADEPRPVMDSGAVYAFCLDDELEENDDFAQAAVIVPGSYSGLQVCGGDEDIFSLTLLADDILDVGILFSHGAGNLDLALYDPAQNLLALSDSQTDNEQLSYQVGSAGDYYIRVYGFEGALSGYVLQASVEVGEVNILHFLPVVSGP